MSLSQLKHNVIKFLTHLQDISWNLIAKLLLNLSHLRFRRTLILVRLGTCSRFPWINSAQNIVNYERLYTTDWKPINYYLCLSFYLISFHQFEQNDMFYNDLIKSMKFNFLLKNKFHSVITYSEELIDYVLSISIWNSLKHRI